MHFYNKGAQLRQTVHAGAGANNVKKGPQPLCIQIVDNQCFKPRQPMSRRNWAPLK